MNDMNEKRFDVLDKNDDVLAENMRLDDAFVFIEGLINKYYMVPSLFSIKDRTTIQCCCQTETK